MTRHRERQTAPCPSHQISTYSTIHNNQKQANIRENRKRESLPYPVEAKEEVVVGKTRRQRLGAADGERMWGTTVDGRSTLRLGDAVADGVGMGRTAKSYAAVGLGVATSSKISHMVKQKTKEQRNGDGDRPSQANLGQTKEQDEGGIVIIG
jgi:hypothetical protein